MIKSPIKFLSFLILIIGITVYQTPAFAKVRNGSINKSNNTSTERPNAHSAQGTGNWKSKKDKHQKAGPQNEKKKKTGKWLRLKK